MQMRRLFIPPFSAREGWALRLVSAELWNL